MYGNELNSINLLAGIVSLIIIIIFFIMSSNLSRIRNILEAYSKIEFKKPEYQLNIKCEKCGKEFITNELQKHIINCPYCNAINKVI